MRPLIFAFIVLLTSSKSFAQLIHFEPISPVGAEVNTVFTWGAEANGFVINANGRMRSTLSRKTVKLPIRKGFFIDNVLVATYEDDLLLAYRGWSGGDVLSYACRIKKGISFIQWCQSVPALNLAAAVGDKAIWLIGSLFTARINPKNGRYAWQHRDNYESFGVLPVNYQVICLIEENKDAITLHAGLSGSITGKEIVLDRATGKVVKIILLQQHNKICTR